MARTQYSPQFKTKLVLEVLGGEKELGTIAYENNISPNMLRSWKREYLDHASKVFENPRKAEKQARRKEESLKKETDQMLKTIGQLTLERDFLQDRFRQYGLPVPGLSKNKLLSLRRQCELLGISRSTLYYEREGPDEKGKGCIMV